MKKHYVIRDVPCEAHFMRNHDHRATFFGELLHNLKNFTDELGVERRCRLIKEHHIRAHCQRPRDRDALLLAAGKMRWILLLHSWCESDFIKIFACAFFCLVTWESEHMYR